MALDYKLMGNRLKEVRMQKGLTQENLAEALNVSIAYVCRIETGKTRLNLKRLNQICGILDIPESYVLNGAADNTSSYLNLEFSNILNDCSARDKELLYKIANIIAEDRNKHK